MVVPSRWTAHTKQPSRRGSLARRDPGGTIGVGRKTVEHSVRGLVSLGFVGEPEPSLVTVVRLDHHSMTKPEPVWAARRLA
jgi:hypothetical protein